MGRPRGGKVSSSSDAATTKLDEKSKSIRTSGRERKELMASYVEESGSGSDREEKEDKEEEEVVSNFEESLSESVSEPESSGSEYGVKKKKKVVAKKRASPAKGKKRGRKAAASPKGRGRKPAASAAAKKSPKGRPAKKSKAASTPTKTRPSRGQANKRMKYRERSDSEEEDSPVLSEESEVEEVMSESEVEEVSLESGSDAEVGKGRKRKAPAEKPKGRPPAKDSVKNGRGRKPKAKKVDSEEEDEEMEDLEERKPAKEKETKEEVKEKKKKKEEDEANGGSEDVSEGSEEDEEDEKPLKPKEVAAKSSAPAVEEPEEEGSVGDGEESVKSSKSSGQGSEKSAEGPKNPTETDYKNISFECTKKTKAGEAPTFRIASWNIGGVKSWIKKNGLEYLRRENPDVLILQEIKSSEKTQPPEVKSVENYPHVYWSFSEQAGHYGVGLLSKVKPEGVTYGLPLGEGDSDEDKKFKESFNKEGRLITAEFNKFFLINAYVPNGGRAVKDGSGGKPYPPKVTSGERGRWDKLFRDHIKELQKKKPVVVAGDLNVAHEEIDLANPKTNSSTAGFTKEEREGFSELLKEAGLVDSFRALHGEEKGAYTFWSYMHNARAKNVGWRLDYFLVSAPLVPALVDTNIRSQVLGSDHAPIVLHLHL